MARTQAPNHDAELFRIVERMRWTEEAGDAGHDTERECLQRIQALQEQADAKLIDDCRELVESWNDAASTSNPPWGIPQALGRILFYTRLQAA